MKDLTVLPEDKNFCEMPEGTAEPDIPLSPQKRRETDRWFKFLFIFCLCILVPLLTYTLIFVDVNRYNGYDHCGNICGQKNVRYEKWNCSGQDMTLKPYITFEGCVSRETYEKDGSTVDWYKQVTSGYFTRLHLMIIVPYLITFGFCLMMVTLLRYTTGFTILGIGVISWLILGTSVVLLCLSNLSGLTVLYAIMIVLLMCSMITTESKICLVIKLLKATTKAVFGNRNVIRTTALTWFLPFIILWYCLVALYFINACGFLTEGRNDGLEYKHDIFMSVTKYFFVIMTYWTIPLIFGVACVMSSGDIADRYFSRNRDGFSVKVTAKYHLGTIVLVTILSVIMLVPRAIFMVLAQVPGLNVFARYCLRYLDGFFSSNVYILTGMHGTSYIQSGKKAVKLSKSSVENSESILYYAHFVLTVAQGLVITGSNFISSFILTSTDSGLTYWNPIRLIIMSYISSEMIFGAFKTAMSTIFFCICEENVLRKENSQSQEEYLNDSKNFFAAKIKEKFPARQTVQNVEQI